MSKYFWNIRIYQGGRYMVSWVKNGITYLTGGNDIHSFSSDQLLEMNRISTAQSVTDHF